MLPHHDLNHLETHILRSYFIHLFFCLVVNNFWHILKKLLQDLIWLVSFLHGAYYSDLIRCNILCQIYYYTNCNPLVWLYSYEYFLFVFFWKLFFSLKEVELGSCPEPLSPFESCLILDHMNKLDFTWNFRSRLVSQSLFLGPLSA